MTESQQFARLLKRLVKEKPSSVAAGNLKVRAERTLMLILKAGGRRAADRAIKGVRLGTLQLSHEQTVSTVSEWRVALERKSPASLVVWLSDHGDLKAVSVRYVAEPKPPRLTPAQRAKHETQEAFYARYMEVGQRWYRGGGPRRLPKSDNVVLLIGELEADVNNGGWAQYLGNKGRRRAMQALAALRTVGARKTADMLTTAMAPRVTEKTLGALDASFYRVPEDLAMLTMRWARAEE